MKSKKTFNFSIFLLLTVFLLTSCTSTKKTTNHKNKSVVTKAKEKTIPKPEIIEEMLKLGNIKIVKKEDKLYFNILGIGVNVGDERFTIQASESDIHQRLAMLLGTYTSVNLGNKSRPCNSLKKLSGIPQEPKDKKIKLWSNPKTKNIYTILEIDIEKLNKSKKDFVSQGIIDEFIYNEAKYKEKLKIIDTEVIPALKKDSIFVKEINGKKYIYAIASESDMGDIIMAENSAIDNANCKIATHLVVKEGYHKTMHFIASKIVKKWTDSKTGRIYVVMELSESIVKYYSTLENKNIKIIEGINKRTEESYKKLDKKLDNVNSF